MLVFPKAKINLGLNITGIRNDGYHNIETIFYPVNLCDAMELVADTGSVQFDKLTVTGHSLPIEPGENIVIKSIRNLRETCSFPFLNVHLHKVIPLGAGLGGGSSDAAGILLSINRLFNLNLTTGQLREIASKLGSDCPFFIESTPSFARGRGEILEPVGRFLKGYYIVLSNPGINISTKEAYESCKPSVPLLSLTELIKNPITLWKDTIINDFEKTIFPRYPLVSDLKTAFYESGSLYSSMSGSGSSVFGIFDTKPRLNGILKKYSIYEGIL